MGTGDPTSFQTNGFQTNSFKSNSFKTNSFQTNSFKTNGKFSRLDNRTLPLKGRLRLTLILLETWILERILPRYLASLSEKKASKPII